MSINSTYQPLEPLKRKFLPQDFTVTTWENLAPYYQKLMQQPLTNKHDFEQWLLNISELEAVVSEDACHRQIKMTCNTTDKAIEEAFTYFVMNIEPEVKLCMFDLHKKLLDTPFVNELDNAVYFPYLRNLNNAVKIFRKENVELQAEANLLAQQYGVINGSLTIEVDGKTYTMPQAVKLLHHPDRAMRQTVFTKITERRLLEKDKLNELFDKLLVLRHKIALNAGFDNYRDYKFRELGRFDYTVEDCYNFHEAVKKHILPIQAKFTNARKQRLGYDVLKPYDSDAEPANVQPLHPFQTGAELIEKAIEVFGRLHPYFSHCLTEMRAAGRLDLESRVGKAPGGYNCPLPETGIPFIFMNAAGTMGDVITMMHEGGHAIHSFLSHPLPISAFKEYPMEIAELASMSMELFSMEHWDVFYPNPAELNRAKLEEMERAIGVLPWIATIDKFQHWLYTHPGHTASEREVEWKNIIHEFSNGIVDWEGYEAYRYNMWQKQLHLFEVPFYYIEYGIAQLGAVALWRVFRQNKEAALAGYTNALAKGYTVTLPELYKTAGIEFNFSPAYIEELAGFANPIIDNLLAYKGE